MNKYDLRRIYLSKRKKLSPDKRKEKSFQIASLFFKDFDLTRIKFLHCFISVERTNEIDTQLIFDKIWRDFPHIETVVPRVNWKTDEIENLKYAAETHLVRNSWGICEPVGSEFVESEKIDLVLVPLLCFDQKGFRVGYGKGFYDKFLKVCRPDCLKIGLSYFEPITKIDDVNEFDVKLDFCITPEQVINCE